MGYNFPTDNSSGFDYTDEQVELEQTARQEADTELQEQIDDLKSRGVIKGSVDTYADLLLVDTTGFATNTMYIVEEDETHNGVTTIYSWTGTTWEYAGKFTIDLQARLVSFESVTGIVSTNVQDAIVEVYNSLTERLDNIESDLSEYVKSVNDIIPDENGNVQLDTDNIITDNSITTEMLQDGSITEEKIGTGAISERTIATKAITPDKLDRTYVELEALENAIINAVAPII